MKRLFKGHERHLFTENENQVQSEMSRACYYFSSLQKRIGVEVGWESHFSGVGKRKEVMFMTHINSLKKSKASHEGVANVRKSVRFLSFQKISNFDAT